MDLYTRRVSAGYRQTAHTDHQLIADGRSPYELTSHELGVWGEEEAAAYLEDAGYEIVARNWCCPRGEADIIARDDDCYVLVEVKARLQDNDEEEVVPEYAVNAAKQRRYRGIAACFMALSEVEYLRFDVIAVTLYDDGSSLIHHITDAFGGDE